MRILLFSHVPKDPDGGSSRVYHLLEDGFKARGHIVKALHYQDLALQGVTGKFLNRLLLPQASSRRVEQEHPEQYDVVMSSSGMLYPLFRRLRHRRPRPLLVSHLHGLSRFDREAVYHEVRQGHMRVSIKHRLLTGRLPLVWDARGSKYADLTIVQNGRDLAALEKHNLRALLRIPLSVHPEILAAGAGAPAPETRPPASFLWFGSWIDRKGSYYLPEAVRLIAARHPEARFTLGGTSKTPADLLAKFAPETRESITVLPRISRAEQIEVFGRNSIFLFPSLSEGFGYALLEAMCMGLAPITTTTGLAGDYLSNRQNAMIVPHASAEALAQAASELIRNPDLRSRLALASQRLARQFTTESMIDAYEAAFLAQRVGSVGEQVS